MFVTMYNFSKRENSTKQPTVAEKTIAGDVCFKANTSLLTPTILWAVGHEDSTEGDDNRTDDEKAMVTNYCEMNGKYYYVTDVRRTSRNHIEFDCRMDLLATYKNEILSTTAYVEYSSSHGRTDIYDNRVAVTCQTSIEEHEEILSIFGGLNNDSSGCVIMNVTSDLIPTEGMGALTSWLMSNSELTTFSNQLNGDSGILQSLREIWTNPIDAIVSIIWLPIPYDDIVHYGEDYLSKANNLHVGNYDASEIKPYKITKPFSISLTYPIEIPREEVNNFTDVNYTIITLYLPYVGVIEVPSNLYYDVDKIEINLTIDILTGDILYLVKASEVIIATYSSNCSMNIPISASNYDITPALSGTLMTLTGNPYAIPMMTGGIQQMLSQGISTQIKGGLGSKVNVYAMPNIQCSVKKSVLVENIEQQKTVRGLPCNQTLLLANLSGYCQTSHASVNCSATLEQKQIINAYLNGGVYIE